MIMFEGVDYFEFKERIRYFVNNGDQYELPVLIMLKKNLPVSAGWYPISIGKRNELGKYLSYWNGEKWSKPVLSNESAQVAGVQAENKSVEMYWWFEPWWLNGPISKGK